ncbi:MAG: cation:proton antiporter [Bryobacteraceae bacterium]
MIRFVFLLICCLSVALTPALLAQEEPPLSAPRSSGLELWPAEVESDGLPGPDDEESPAAVPPAPPKPPTSATEVVKAILGLVVLVVLAYLGGHPKVQQIEDKLRISQVVTAGLPFVLLGVIAHHPNVEILSDGVLHAIRPILPLGLGWIGFAVGFRFDAQSVEALPKGAARAVALTTLLPFAAIVASCGLVLFFTDPSLAGSDFLRDAIILGTAGAMTARTVPRLMEAMGVEQNRVARVSSIVQLEQLAGVLGLMMVAAYFRPQGSDVGWQLPGTAWLFITLGAGTMMGGVIYAMLGRLKAGPEFTVLLLGSVCFAAGMSSFLRLSPVAVCFIAGVILVNFPGGWKQDVREALERLERPIYLLFLVIAGALWQPADWRGWVLMALFVSTRLAGKWFGMHLFRKHRMGDLNPEEERALALAPIGALSIAIVVNAQDLYFGPALPWMVTAVIGGGIATEIILQAFSRNTPTQRESIERMFAPGD